MINTSTATGSLIDDLMSDDNNNKDTSSSNSLQEDEDDPFTFRSRKSYPQRNNRPKLNYRDLERGLYDTYELRQSMWALGGPTAFEKTDTNRKTSNNGTYSDDEDESMTANEENDEGLGKQNEKISDDSDQMHRRLWCICKKPWDHSRLMLRCDTCANWYHGDCIGFTKEKARILDMNGDQFVCPPCQGVTAKSPTKPVVKSSDDPAAIKRKRIDAMSPIDRKVGERNGNMTAAKPLSNSEPSKRPKTGIFFQRDTSAEPQIHCIVHGCTNWAKPGWVYCSPACIRRHINDTLQGIQRSKGSNNDSPPTREDILLYENRTKKVLDRKLVPKIEDLCTWINQHPSYEIVKPALRQSILLIANEPKSPSPVGMVRSSSIPNTPIPKLPTTPTPAPSSAKPKLSWAPIVPNAKPVPIKKAPVQIGKPAVTTTTTTSTTTASNTSTTPNYADIRMKVPQALYDKLTMRLEKSGEKITSKEDIRVLVNKIEEEMYRVFGKVDNSYKNKFRSLLANISNMNNNFFYKHILSKEVTPKQIVAMKAEDMLPPEEKEKRKDEFEKEVRMIIKAEEQTAEEMARRAKIKVTRQGLVDNDTHVPVYRFNEHDPAGNKNNESTQDTKTPSSSETKVAKVKTESSTTTKSIVKAKKPINSASTQKSTVKPKPKPKPETVSTPKDTTSLHGQHTFDINCSICSNSTASKSISLKTSPTSPTEIIPPLIEPPSVTTTDEPSIEPTPVKLADEPMRLPSVSPARAESHEVSNSVFPSVDFDNDYIEPESPTGIDALLYDDDDDFNGTNNHSRTSANQHQHPESPGDITETVITATVTPRDDYNPLAASKPKTEASQVYQPTPINRPSTAANHWRGTIISPDSKVQCQSLRLYGDSEYLIGDIPEQLNILGRLRLGDLWDYVRGSIPVRDVIILTLASSNNNENNVFSRYVDTMRASGRAAVISKITEPSSIRDMYVLAADTKECPANILSALSMSSLTDPKQLFLVVIGSGKRTNKQMNRPNQSQSWSSITYKPVSLQDAVAARDPRLSRNKDPRLAGNTPTEPTPTSQSTISTSQPASTTITKSIPTVSSTENLSKLMTESIDRIRHAKSLDDIKSIALSTIEQLKANRRDDLCSRFTGDLQIAMSEWKPPKEESSPSVVLSGDNLNEENMEVDDEQEEKLKKQTTTSMTEFNDVDYRFLDQDMDHRMMASAMPIGNFSSEQHNDIPKTSPFAGILSGTFDADHRTIQSTPIIEQKEKPAAIAGNDSDFRLNDVTRASSK